MDLRQRFLRQLADRLSLLEFDHKIGLARPLGLQHDICPTVAALQIGPHPIIPAQINTYAQKEHMISVFTGPVVETGAGQDDPLVSRLKIRHILALQGAEKLVQAIIGKTGVALDDLAEAGHHFLIGDAYRHLQIPCLRRLGYSQIAAAQK